VGRSGFGGVGEQALAGVGGQGEGLEGQVEVADDGMVEELDAAGVDSDVVRGPALSELFAAGGQLPDQVREVPVVGVAAGYPEVRVGRRARRQGAPVMESRMHWTVGRTRWRAGRRRGGRVLPAAKGKGKEIPTPCHFQHIAHRGACGKTRIVPQNLRRKPEPAEMACR
jgi:hypothetical protein